MSDKKDDLEDLFFDSNCEISDNISIVHRRKYAKFSWVWKYFEVSKNGIHDVCKVEILNLSDEKVKCEYKFLHDNSTENMNTPNFHYEELSDDDSDDSENDTSELTNDSSQNTYLFKSMCYIIYNSLFDYWNESLMVGLLATLLDSRLKTLSSWDQKTQEKVKAELTCQFKNIATPNHEQTTSIYTTSSNSNNIYHNHLRSSIFSMSTSTYTASNPLSELECYLDPTQTPIAKDIINPFEW
ncbi:13761_t:CDS:2 [Cetraspora pellucida]|uniref:13761_t:CDS:1 n=1 Tax=Cetraspora pellucida TaxID=1433469 RepID=A0ACA9LBG7_9GLOM|nr:13761_t:CDS:2 [Cetraspora pellucida]